MSSYENLLSRLEGVCRIGSTATALCPSHKDKNPSLSIREDANGTVLVKCHAGCDALSIVHSVGLEVSDLFPESDKDSRMNNHSPFTVRELAKQKRLPPDFLGTLGLAETDTHIRIPYYQADGTEARPQIRRRDGGHHWGKPDTLPIIPYGSDRLDSEEAILVEGCSDCWTLWYAGFAAIGIPGASMHNKLKAEHIQGLERIYIVREADEGGAKFEHNIRERLRALGFAGEVFSIDMARLGAKDPSELFIRDPDGFEDAWRQALTKARENVVEDERTEALVTQRVSAWLEDVAGKQQARRLFGECWFEGELCILFAETNVGKSILAIQIADAITRGQEVLPGFGVDVEAETVLYIDFELSPRQFLGRYSGVDGTPYSFAPGLLRAETNIDFDFVEGWEQEMRDAIENAIVESGARIVIVDNLTYLKDETEKSKAAIPLMRHLNTLKKRYELSILANAHTPKRDGTRPLCRNDLAGSRGILNLCDSCFAIGESHRDVGIRYLKQIKVRETDFSLTTENVVLLSLDKHGSFLGFNLLGYGSELEHLRARNSSETKELDAKILALKDSEPGLSNREIARRLETYHVKVSRVLKRPIEGCARGTEVEQSGTGGTGVPVYHPPNKDRNGTLPESGTVEQVFQGVPLVPTKGKNTAPGETPDPWDDAPRFGVGGDA